MINSFLRKIIILSILPIFTIVCIDIWLRSQNSIYLEKYEGLLDQRDSVNVLFLGNSHANYGVDPSQFEDYYVYNLANVSQKIYFDKRLTIKAINEGVSNLKAVCISVDYHSLFTSSQEGRNVWSYYANGIEYKDTNYFLANMSPFIWGYTPRISLALIVKYFKNQITYSGTNIIDFDVESGVDVRDSLLQGYIGMHGTNQSVFSERYYLERSKKFSEPKNSERVQVIEDLEGFISELKKLNIEPILYSLPTYTEYNHYLDNEVLERNRNDLEFICKKHKLEYWNYMFDSRFKKEDFFNCDHLNKNGAKKISTILSSQLNRYLELKEENYLQE